MTPRHRLITGLAIAMAAMCNRALLAEPLTIEQAQQLSKATGRPILAMGGSKT